MKNQLDQFDIFKDFELREVIEKNNKNLNEQNALNKIEPGKNINYLSDMENMIKTLPYINDNIRYNIKFGLAIYKELNNFEQKYIHSIIYENSTKSKK